MKIIQHLKAQIEQLEIADLRERQKKKSGHRVTDED